MYLNSPFQPFALPQEIIQRAKAFCKARKKEQSLLISVDVETGDSRYDTELAIYLYCPEGSIRAYYNEPWEDVNRLLPVEADDNKSIWDVIADNIVVSATVHCRVKYSWRAGDVFRHHLKIGFLETETVRGKVVKVGRNSYALQ